MSMDKKVTGFIKAGFAYFIWSLLGPFLNLSSFTPMQNIWLLSIFGLLIIL